MFLSHGLERAKEDYPEDSQVVVNKVFYEWWDRCNLKLGQETSNDTGSFWLHW